MHSVAVIRQLGRYPVKSMRGESLATATLTLQGCTGGPALRVRPDGLAQLLSLAHCPGATGTALLPHLRGGSQPAGSRGDGHRPWWREVLH
jgi:hypothetical protein